MISSKFQFTNLVSEHIVWNFIKFFFFKKKKWLGLILKIRKVAIFSLNKRRDAPCHSPRRRDFGANGVEGVSPYSVVVRSCKKVCVCEITSEMAYLSSL